MFRIVLFLLIPIVSTDVTEKFLTKIQQENVDIIFIFDRSNLSSKNKFYINQKPLVKIFIRSFMKISEKYSHVGIISYGRDVTIEFDGISKNTNTSKCFLVDNEQFWNNIEYSKSPNSNNGSVLHEALQAAIDIFEIAKTDSSPRSRIIFLFSNGVLKEDEQLVNSKFNKLKQSTIDVFVAGNEGGSGLAVNDGGYGRIALWENRLDQKLTMTIGDKNNHDKKYSSVPYKKDCLKDNETPLCNVISGYSSCLCSAGYYRKEFDCSKCEVNTFKETIGDGKCISCPPGYGTSSKGSTKGSDCKCLEVNTCRGSCDNKICKNGKCNLGSCVCNEGYTGETCEEKINYCSTNPCKNYGQCKSLFFGPFCYCINDYEGEFCQNSISECGNDLCAPGFSCLDKIYGYDCINTSLIMTSTKLPKEEDNNTSIQFLIIIICAPIGVLFVILIISIIGFQIWKRKRRVILRSRYAQNTHGQKSPPQLPPRMPGNIFSEVSKIAARTTTSVKRTYRRVSDSVWRVRSRKDEMDDVYANNPTTSTKLSHRVPPPPPPPKNKSAVPDSIYSNLPCFRNFESWLPFFEETVDFSRVSMLGVIKTSTEYILDTLPCPTEKDIASLRSAMEQKRNGLITVLKHSYIISSNNGTEMHMNAKGTNNRAQILYIIKASSYFILSGTTRNNFSTECLQKAKEIASHLAGFEK
ncbi:DgyrCDS13800 [Dimorphilus gyrociliatus]|uniref:DgyrCDS13800 n=1 Tax=Dimorphilus gyrociliatus TaxID=2664684 RepID=A0A7I8WBZ5_9ANNE|nr:DgyrCDS13800 [Dimorphilus gyrociliatus]